MPTPAPSFPIPVVALGPGSQDEDDGLNYLALPRGMHTYHAPSLPEAEATRHLGPARRLLAELARALDIVRTGEAAAVSLDLGHLDAANLALVNQALGEGEVSARVGGNDDGAGGLRIQESVLAGVWRVRREDADGRLLDDRVEVADVPEAVRRAARSGLGAVPDMPPAGPGVVNAPALLAEIADRVGQTEAHVINLSLLPFSPEDGAWLDQALGRGRVSLLSRGYGNCRITATGLARVWWVQFFNSQDALILNTLEIADVPEVARAAPEDLEDSRERLGEILEWIG